MTANELMIGDWVMSFGAPHKIVGVRADSFYPYIKTDISDTWYEDGMEDLLNPIPLTPEILEKNGFEKIGGFITDEAYIFDKEESGEANLIIRRFDFNESFVICTPQDQTARISIGYVHELQHALRLAGINKEIVL